MRSIQNTATVAFDSYGILYAGYKTMPASVQGVGVNLYIDMDFASSHRCETYWK